MYVLARKSTCLIRRQSSKALNSCNLCWNRQASNCVHDFVQVQIKMPNFRENRALILQSYLSGILSDEEFVLLYDVNTSKNPDFPYWNYERFDLDKLSDEESKAEFRFYKSDIF